MNEQLLKDFMLANKQDLYVEDSSLENIRAAGEWVMFEEQSACGHYVDTHQIPLLDIVAWVYAQLKD